MGLTKVKLFWRDALRLEQILNDPNAIKVSDELYEKLVRANEKSRMSLIPRRYMILYLTRDEISELIRVVQSFVSMEKPCYHVQSDKGLLDELLKM